MNLNIPSPKWEAANACAIGHQHTFLNTTGSVFALSIATKNCLHSADQGFSINTHNPTPPVSPPRYHNRSHQATRENPGPHYRPEFRPIIWPPDHTLHTTRATPAPYTTPAHNHHTTNTLQHTTNTLHQHTTNTLHHHRSLHQHTSLAVAALVDQVASTAALRLGGLHTKRRTARHLWHGGVRQLLPRHDAVDLF